MPEENSAGKHKPVPTAYHSKGKSPKPYSLSGLTKFFMVLGAITFLPFSVLYLLSVYLPQRSYSRLGLFYGEVEYAFEVKTSAVIFLLEAIVYTILVIAAFSINKRHELRLAERVDKLTGIAGAIIAFLIFFMFTCVGVAVWTGGEVIFLPGGGSLILIFVINSG